MSTRCHGESKSRYNGSHAEPVKIDHKETKSFVLPFYEKSQKKIKKKATSLAEPSTTSPSKFHRAQVKIVCVVTQQEYLGSCVSSHGSTNMHVVEDMPFNIVTKQHGLRTQNDFLASRRTSRRRH